MLLDLSPPSLLFTGENLSVLFNFVHSNVFPTVIIPDRLNN